MRETKSPLTRLVLFMIALSVAGSVLAGIHYYAVDLPQQKSAQAPANTMSAPAFGACFDDCMLKNCGYRNVNCGYGTLTQKRVQCIQFCGSQ